MIKPALTTLMAGFLLLAGCTVGPKFKRPVVATRGIGRSQPLEKPFGLKMYPMSPERSVNPCVRSDLGMMLAREGSNR